MRALKRRTATSSKISYHQGDKWSLSKSLLWWPSPCRMLTLVPPDEDLAHSFLKCPSPQPWGTICMLHETFLHPLRVHDLSLQSVSIKHHLLSSSKKSPTDCFSLQETPLHSVSFDLLFAPTLALPRITKAITKAESVYCRSHSLWKSSSHSPAHLPLAQPSGAESRARQHVSRPRFSYHQEE